jgi:hypothetical protein
MFAFHRMENGGVDFIGEIFSEASGVIRLQVVDAIIATGCGMWSLTDEICDVPKSECRMFLDQMSCLEEALKINNAIYAKMR